MVCSNPEAGSGSATASGVSAGTFGVAESRQISLALSVAHEFMERHPGMFAPTERAMPNPAMLLTLLTWCYARNLLSSDEIARRSGVEPALRYLSAGETVAMNDLRRFRRRHSPAIRSCLREFFLRSCAVQSGPSPAADVFRLRLASAEKLAEERLTLAIFTDTAMAEL